MNFEEIKEDARSEDWLSEDERGLISRRREIERNLGQGMPNYFFRMTTPEEREIWINLLLTYRLTQSDVSVRAASSVYQVKPFAIDSTVRSLESLRDEEIIDASIFFSFQPLWAGGKAMEMARFLIRSTEPLPPETEEAYELPLPEEKIREIVGALPHLRLPASDIIGYLKRFRHDFLAKASVERVVSYLDLYIRALDTDALLVRAETFRRKDTQQYGYNRIILAATGVKPKGNILSVARVFRRMNLILHRVDVTTIRAPGEEKVAGLSGYYVTSPNNRPLVEGTSEYQRLLAELRTVKWVPDEDRISQLVGFVSEPEKPTAAEAHFLRVSSTWVNQILCEIDPLRYSLETIEELYVEYPEFSRSLIRIFMLRCHPFHRNSAAYNKHQRQLLTDLEALSTGVFSNDEVIRRVFTESIRFIKAILKTNFFVKDRAGVSVLLHPDVLVLEPSGKAYFDPLPVNLYYVYGTGFKAYHVSFFSFARGGVRTLLPASALHYQTEAETVLRECYDLAFTQHLKNKDIPEGGSKGIILVQPGMEKEVCQRVFIRELVDILIAEEAPDRMSEIAPVGEGGTVIFLGPDENMDDSMIVWIDAYVKSSGYSAGAAFMSGHPKQGINHKLFGVTSRGVHTYLNRCLAYRGIDPRKDRFSVKFSGGPDGDVAGNCMKLLLEDFPSTVRIVAITDGSGCCREPAGLDNDVLSGLIQRGQGIAHYSPEKLKSEDAFLLRTTRNPEKQPALLFRKQEGVVLEIKLDQNRANRLYAETLHQTPADVFIPAGGRPRTLNDRNWTSFLIEGKPSAGIVVEGANLFFSSEARTQLEKKGVLLIKDSSANKGGVITSSYEVLGLLLFGDERFSRMIPEFIPELQKILARKAGREADWLLKRYRESGEEASLSLLSHQYSQEASERRMVVRSSLETSYDAVDRLLRAGVSATEMDEPLAKFAAAFGAYLPRTFRAHISIPDAWKRLKPEHRKAIIAVQLTHEE
ncbi:MAG: NAD-glutamate dehydrogenase domain-containing protein [Opitutales bacterium]